MITTLLGHVFYANKDSLYTNVIYRGQENVTIIVNALNWNILDLPIYCKKGMGFNVFSWLLIKTYGRYGNGMHYWNISDWTLTFKTV